MKQNVNTIERDHMREQLFKEAYGLDAKIRVTNHTDEDWNWDMVVLNFKDSLGKNYGLIEYFKEGNDNSTKEVVLEYEGKDGVLAKSLFIRFIDAELAMVEIMRKRLEGKE